MPELSDQDVADFEDQYYGTGQAATRPVVAPPQTRTVIGPDRSIYSAGPYSQYNADPTQIPADNPLPPVYPPGYQPWQPPPRDPEQEQVDQMQKDLATGALNPQEMAQSMNAVKAARKLMSQRRFSSEIQNAKTDADRSSVLAKYAVDLFGDNPTNLLKALTPKPAPLTSISSIPIEGLKDYRAVPSATGQGYTVHRAVSDEAIKKMTPAQAGTMLAKIPELAAMNPSITNRIPLLERRAFEGLDAGDKKKTLTKEQAGQFLKQANGNKAKARQLAKDAGYDF